MIQLKAVFKGVTEEKTKDGKKVFSAVATTLDLDRYNEVVLPKGVILDNFLQNPVLLSQHDYGKDPIGAITDIKVGKSEILVKFVFDETDPDAAKTMRKYEQGIMKSFSIGFLPKTWMYGEQLRDEKGNPAKKVECALPDGSTYKLDLTQYKQTPSVVYTGWELLELSTVSVPANPGATMMALRSMAVENAGIAKSFIEEKIDNEISMLENVIRSVEEFEIPSVVAFKGAHMVDIEWDPVVATARLAKWASEDGTGTKEKMNWAKYAKGFTLVDPEKIDTFSAYKFLHHDVIKATREEDGVDEDTFVCIQKGLTQCMSDCLALPKDTPHLKEVYTHLAAHYAEGELGLECPALDKTYSSEELAAIADGTYKSTKVDETPVEKDGVGVPPVAASPDIEVAFKALREMLDERFIGLNIQIETVLETISELASRAVKKEADPPAPIPPAEDPIAGELRNVLSAYPVE